MPSQEDAKYTLGVELGGNHQVNRRVEMDSRSKWGKLATKLVAEASLP
jgi:hypothetical protein